MSEDVVINSTIEPSFNIIRSPYYWQNRKPPLGSQLDRSNYLTRGLISYWLFNEGVGSKSFDLCGGSNLTLNAAFIASSVGLNAYNVSPYYLSIPSTSKFNATSYTFIARCRLTFAGANPVVLFAGINGTSYCSVGSGATVAAVGGTSVTVSNTTWVDRLMHTIAFVRSSSGLFVYRDGKLIGSSGLAGLGIATGEIRLFGFGASYNLVGSVENASYYSRALSNNEILELYYNPYKVIRVSLFKKYFLPSLREKEKKEDIFYIKFPNINLKRYSKNKPPPGSRINWNHPLSKGLVGCWLMNEGSGNGLIDVIYPSNLMLAKNINRNNEGISLDGVSSYASVSLNNKITRLPTIGFSVYFKFSYLRPYVLTSNPIETVIGTYTENNWLPYGWRIRCDHTSYNQPRILYEALYATTAHTITGVAGSIITGKKHDVCVVDRGVSGNVWVDGVNMTASDVSPVGTYQLDTGGTNNGLRIGANFYRSVTAFFQGNIECVFIYSRALSAAEILELYRNPNQIIDPPISKKYYSFPDEEVYNLEEDEQQIYSPYLNLKKYNKNKPPVGSRIDWNHPLSKKLVGCWLMNEGAGVLVKNLTNKNNGRINGPKWVGTKLQYTANTDNVDLGNILFSSYSELSVVIHFVAPTGTQSGMLAENGTSFNTNTFYLYSENNSTLQFSVYGTSFQTVTSPASTVLKGKLNMVVGVWRSNLLPDIFVNGKMVSDTRLGVSQLASLINGNTNLLLGKRPESTTLTFAGGIESVSIYSRSLFSSEMLELYYGPYQLIKYPGYNKKYFTPNHDVIIPQSKYPVINI